MWFESLKVGQTWIQHHTYMQSHPHPHARAHARTHAHTV